MSNIKTYGPTGGNGQSIIFDENKIISKDEFREAKNNLNVLMKKIINETYEYDVREIRILELAVNAYSVIFPRNRYISIMKSWIEDAREWTETYNESKTVKTKIKNESIIRGVNEYDAENDANEEADAFIYH